jgi:hypothetical protein
MVNPAGLTQSSAAGDQIKVVQNKRDTKEEIKWSKPTHTTTATPSTYWSTTKKQHQHDKTKHTQEVCILKNNAIKKRRSQILDY